ncbi:HAD family hydrolase [Occallatibacter savannae]|uniref:HAD family hydrolase n=1 Tax=Occallatibacter savannae TaxID=1002691 RepID=UPI0013A58205|nr:HAD hydrolase-like protein [Occallatibacter savannae]
MESTLQPAADDRLGPRGSLTRPWDEFDAYLFDVDGTLLNCKDAVHYFAFCEALKALAGRELNLDGVTAHGNTDIGILRDALNLAGVAEADWRPRVPEACMSMAAYVEANRDEIITEALPATREVLQHLRAKKAVLGVATGNLESIGKIKLDACGLLQNFDFFAFSDGLETRADVYKRALERACDLAGPDAAICAVGDTPADVRAAQHHGIEVIAVATGIHPREELSREQPDLCLSSLSELLP